LHGRKQLQVGSFAFVETVKGELGAKAQHRELEQVDGKYALRESGGAYGGQIDSKNEAKTRKHTFMGEILAWSDPEHRLTGFW
jgi:hypothetical protein